MNSEIEDVSKCPFPRNDTEAKERFEKYRKNDPLPDVKPALLNSGDIYDYTRITGMIWPFATDPNQLKKKLKPASYEVDFLGTVYFIDDQGEPQKQQINRDIPFTLKQNSIAYIYIETIFRLPDYIALRFNLKITHVHRGLLLGTGPLVDPGFCGPLLIPLHNLTSKDYTLKGGDGLIWVEFTKLSPHRHWDSRARKDAYEYVTFPIEKTDSILNAQAYLNKATEDGQPARSSLPGVVKSAKEDAEKAKVSAEKSESMLKKFTFWGAIGGGVALLALLVSLVALVYNTWSFVNETKKDVLEMKKEFANFQVEVHEKFRDKASIIPGQTTTGITAPNHIGVSTNQPVAAAKRRTLRQVR